MPAKQMLTCNLDQLENVAEKKIPNVVKQACCIHSCRQALFKPRSMHAGKNRGCKGAG